ncbi:N-acetyltransferase [Mycetocola reblochoni]|uniref:N-acetyltransferase n=2 Tax=Mycetocola reblochoni TaxID=331618 RepID=A0A3L6ZIH6_9MICO|nr:N-acetyltransferase [Mycetocola reblochoni]
MPEHAPVPVPVEPIDRVSWPLLTDRLRLRRATPDDVEAIWRHRRLPEVSRWITSGPDDLDSFRAQMDEPGRLTQMLLIERLDDPTRLPVGDVTLRIGDGWSQREVRDRARNTEAELGWTLHPDVGGHGYATEAVRAVIDRCFTELGLRRVTAGCFADNEPSWRLMERLGMRREEHSKATALHRTGVWLDGMNYGVLASEWPAAATGRSQT